MNPTPQLAMSTDNQQEALTSRPAWKSYSASPTKESFRSLWASATTTDIRIQMPQAMVLLWRSSGNWKVAQHASIVARTLGLTTLASYLAIRAIHQSGGNVRARLILAQLYWERRLAVAVLNETEIARMTSRRIGHGIRAEVRIEIAKLKIKAHAYLGDLASALRWMRFLEASDGATDLETLIYLLFCACRRGAVAEQTRISLLLAPHFASLGPRPQATVVRVVRRVLLSMLRLRP